MQGWLSRRGITVPGQYEVGLHLSYPAALHEVWGRTLSGHLEMYWVWGADRWDTLGDTPGVFWQHS